MAEILNIFEHRPKAPDGELRTPMQQLFDDYAHRPINPYKDILIAYACGLSKRLQPSVQMLARYNVYTISDLLKYTEEEFFSRFSFRPKQKEQFLRKVFAAGARFNGPN